MDDVLWLQSGESPTASQLLEWRQSWRISLSTISQDCAVQSHLTWRRNLSHEIGAKVARLTLLYPELGQAGATLKAKSGLTDQDWCLLPLFGAAANEGRLDLLEKLDAVAMETTSPGIAARVLACIADLLGAFAKGKGGLRSGPGSNKAFCAAYDALELGTHAGRKQGVSLMAAERTGWLSSPDALIRASRHYESAGAILIRHAVLSAEAFIKTREGEAPTMGTWCTAETAARIDLSGGWTDTPPITYEHGASPRTSTLNAASHCPSRGMGMSKVLVCSMCCAGAPTAPPCPPICRLRSHARDFATHLLRRRVGH